MNAPEAGPEEATAQAQAAAQYRAAVIGAGPAGFYAAESLLKAATPIFTVDVIERLPMPYGLVRYGVAPDHQKIKSVTKAFDKVANNPRCRFIGNVQLGHDVAAAELLACYDVVVLCMGCGTDRKLGIPGEELRGCYPATKFVAWYNGHPDFRDFPVSLAGTHAVVVGAGDVSMDITRMLCRKSADLNATDIAPYAAKVFEQNRLKRVSIVIRRGPEHTPFALKELHDIVELDNVTVKVDAAAVSAALADETNSDTTVRRKLEYLAQLAQKQEPERERVVEILFHRSPTEIRGQNGHITQVKLAKNAVVKDANGVARAESTGESEWLDAELVFPAVGYRAEPTPGLAFDDQRGIIPNQDGRVLDTAGQIVPRLYSAGWLKRGPSGVIGTNKLDANETVELILQDLRATSPNPVTGPNLDDVLRQRGVRVVSFADWQRLDSAERTRGEAVGKVREKFTSLEEALVALS
jgi:ferredoxin--NADP+ reductase